MSLEVEKIVMRVDVQVRCVVDMEIFLTSLNQDGGVGFFRAVKTLILFVIGLLVTGCGKKETPKQQEETPAATRGGLIPNSILGTYKSKSLNASREILLTFRVNDVLEYNYSSDTARIGRWKLINNEVVVTFQTKIRDRSESVDGDYYKVDYYEIKRNGYTLLMVGNGKKLVKDGTIKRRPPDEDILYIRVTKKFKKEPRLAEPILERKIREQILKPKGELTNADLEKVWDLDLGRNELTSVPKGLEKLTQLTLLGLNNNQLINVKGLEKLTQLNNLLLHENKLTDIKGLGELMQLKTLELTGNQLTNVKGLEKLTNLEYLNLNNNQLTSVAGLEKLTKLKGLFLKGNQLTKAQIAELQKALPKCRIHHDFE